MSSPTSSSYECVLRCFPSPRSPFGQPDPCTNAPRLAKRACRSGRTASQRRPIFQSALTVQAEAILQQTARTALESRLVGVAGHPSSVPIENLFEQVLRPAPIDYLPTAR